jgi:predicted nucleic acid-binding protein
VSAGKTVALDARSYATLLRQASREGVAGGSAYDLVTAACAVKAKASELLTFNARDFLAFSAKGLEIVVPAAPGR